MEEILIAVISLVVEIAAEILVYLPWDELLWFFERRPGPGKPLERPLTGVFLIGIATGGVIGILSVQVFQKTMLPYAWLRIANIAVAPTVSGLLAHRTARRRTEKGKPSSPKHHFVFAFALTLAVVLVRFIDAARPL